MAEQFVRCTKCPGWTDPSSKGPALCADCAEPQKGVKARLTAEERAKMLVWCDEREGLSIYADSAIGMLREALDSLDAAESELRDVRFILAAIVKQNGGELRVFEGTLIDIGLDWTLIHDSEVRTNDVIFRLKEAKPL